MYYDIPRYTKGSYILGMNFHQSFLEEACERAIHEEIECVPDKNRHVGKAVRHFLSEKKIKQVGDLETFLSRAKSRQNFPSPEHRKFAERVLQVAREVSRFKHDLWRAQKARGITNHLAP